MAHCENCGTRIASGFCPNCEEEAFIANTQADYMPDYLSDEFVRKVETQEAEAFGRQQRARQRETRLRGR